MTQGRWAGFVVTPNTKTGWHDEYENNLEKYTRLLGKLIGRGIVALTVLILGLELALNPIFLFTNSGQNGVDLPIFSFGFWVVLLVSPATTGIQYALFEGRARGGGGRLGRNLAWAIAVMDTAMDGGGILSWLESVRAGHIMGTDTTGLAFGLIPDFNTPWWEWTAWGIIMALCFFHERFLEMFLGRETFEPGPDANAMSVEIAIQVEKAGKIFKKVKLYAIAGSPYIMAALDMLLFAQSVRGENGAVSVLYYFFSAVITAATMTVWEYYTHLRERGYKVVATKQEHKAMQLDRLHRVVFMVAIGATFGDSVGDLAGFNQLIFGTHAGLVPDDWRLVVPFLLTAGLVLTMTTAFEPMNSDLFGPIVSLAHRLPGGGDGGFAGGGPGPGDFGGPAPGGFGDPGFGGGPFGGGPGDGPQPPPRDPYTF